MLIDKNHRALLVVNNVITYGDSKLVWLYQFIEGSGVILADTILKPQYGTYQTLVGAKATKDAFVAAIRALGSMSSVSAIDVILNLHGGPDKLWFADGGVATSTLESTLAELNLKHKLRLLYSTACYGRSHTDNFVAAGFTAASGAIGTNTNSAVEYSSVLTLWATGMQFKDAIAMGENIVTRAPADAAAKLMGFSDANSDKVIFGDGRITINSSS